MAATVLADAGEFSIAGAEASGDSLWMPARDAQAVTGWVAKAEGLCRGEVCVPLPAGREQEFAQGARVNVAALWRHLGQVLVHSRAGHVWVLAASGRDRAAALASLQAPDFTLPDPAGRLHALSDYRGRKILLVTWASW
jgi:hypothetical protein